MKISDHKILPLLKAFPLAMLLWITACQDVVPAGRTAEITSRETVAEAGNKVAVAVSDQQKEYPPVYQGPRIPDGDSLLAFQARANDIKSAVHGEAPHRIFPRVRLQEDSVSFQVLEDWHTTGKVWQMDYAQTGGDFSFLQFPQIGEGDVVKELHREYSYDEGALFLVTENIFANRADGSEVIHRSHYLFAGGKLINWYRDAERYQINPRFYSLADNLFPPVNGLAFHTWADQLFADPRAEMEAMVNLYGEGATLDEAISHWIEQAMAANPVVVSGRKLAGDEYSEPVIWLQFAEGPRARGAAFTVDYGEMDGTMHLDDGVLVGMAYAQPADCQTPGDLIVSLDWLRREKLTHLTESFYHPEASIEMTALPNPLYFNGHEADHAFDENGLASWSWYLPGSQEKMLIQKTESGVFWRDFEGAYH